MKNLLSLTIAVAALIGAFFSIYANKKNKALALENSVTLSKIQATLDSLVLDANFKSLNADQIVAKSMQIIDSDGKKRVSIDIKEGQSIILLNDENGQMSVELAASSTSNYIELSHMDGQKPRITIGDPKQEYAPLFFTGVIDETIPWVGADTSTADRPYISLAEELNNFVFQSTAVREGVSQSFLLQVGPNAPYASPFIASVTNNNTTTAGISANNNGQYETVASFEYDKEGRQTFIGVADIENNFTTALGYLGDQSGFWGSHYLPEDEDNSFFLGYLDTEYLDPPILEVYEENKLTLDWNLTSSK